jgi:transcriptional regulator with XRE-family HTH domain
MDKKYYPYVQTASKLKQLRGPLEPKAFAEMLGIEMQTYYRYERGEREVPPPVMKLAQLLQPSIYKDGILRDETPASGTADAEGVFGKIEQWDIGGEKRPIAVFEPKTKLTSPPPLGRAVEMLNMILFSGDQMLIDAIMANLTAFSQSIIDRQADREEIAQLHRDMAQLKNRLDTLNLEGESKKSVAT